MGASVAQHAFIKNPYTTDGHRPLGVVDRSCFVFFHLLSDQRAVLPRRNGMPRLVARRPPMDGPTERAPLDSSMRVDSSIRAMSMKRPSGVSPALPCMEPPGFGVRP